MSEYEAVKANLVIELNVTCPDCDFDFDMLSDTDLNDEGDLIEQAIGEGRWEVDSDKRIECSPSCPNCNLLFKVKGLNW